MQCPACRHENPADFRFCESCGARLERSCLTCGESASPSASFCGKCGSALESDSETPADASGVTAEQPASSAPTAEAERRQLTVLFCDLVDSTRLASQMDAEDWREVVRGYQESVAKCVDRFGGHVAKAE